MDKQRQLDDFFGIPSPDKEENKSKHRGSIKEIFNRNNRSFKAKLRLLPKILSRNERFLIIGLLLIITGSIFAIPVASFYHFTEPVAAYGGSMKEGILGEPRHINPLLAQSDADRDLVKLVYSGLLKYNSEGKLVPDMAKSYDISSDELSYTIYLREGLKWHDGESVTADDVIFTIKTSQNPDYGSSQRINWQGVEFEKADELTVILRLKNKYAQFLNNLTLPLLPEHVWSNVKPINFALSEYNLKPVGSGPYEFKKLQKDSLGRISLYEFSASDNYYGEKPYIEKLQFKFYNSEDEMINAYNKNEIQNLSLITSKNLDKIKFKQRLTVEKIIMPRYFGIFFNQNQSAPLSDKNIRLALAHGTDKQALVDKILEGNGTAVNSPLLPALLGMNDADVKKYEFNPGLAEEYLGKSDWKEKDESGILTKKDQKLTIKLTTSTWPELVEAANAIKEQWKALGVDVSIEILPTPELQQSIKERNYEMLLFGEILSLDPDPFTLWHSSQKRDPGLNLSLYDNKTADTLLEEARKTLNPLDRAGKYGEFQKLIIDDVPALFLYSPYYLYGHSKNIMGVEGKIIANPSERFQNIDKWYINTKRVLK